MLNLLSMTGSFISILNLFIFLVIFLFWCLSLLLEPFIIRKKRDKTIKSKEDKGTYLLIYLSVFISISISFTLGFNEIELLPEFVFYFGIIFMVLGIFLREYSVVTLRKYFTFKITVLEDQKLIQSGPYHYIRHPAYTGGILAIIGTSLALRSSIAIIVVVLFCAIAYSLRINFEEKLLMKAFGNDYISYKKKTKMLIPFIL